MDVQVYRWGADVYCGEETSGKLARVVVDPKTACVSDLIVERGILAMKRAWVIPRREVLEANSEGVWLSLGERQLVASRPYARRVVEEVAPGYGGGTGGGSLPNPAAAQATVPMVRRVIHDGIASPELVVLERGIEVRDQQELNKVGKLEELVVDAGTGEITQLVAKPGLFGDNVTFHGSAVEDYDESRILVRGEPQPAVEADAEMGTRTPIMDHVPGGLPLPARIEAALRDDRRTQDEVIEVVEQQGVVTLMGEVRDADTARAAEAIARQQQGVVSVYNNLKIRS